MNGGEGTDRLVGSAGDDSYIDLSINRGAYSEGALIESPSEGNDTLYLDAKNRTLDENVENLVLIGWKQNTVYYQGYYGYLPTYLAYDGKGSDNIIKLVGNSENNTIDATNYPVVWFSMVAVATTCLSAGGR
ncbi:hypothetical protein [Xylophilus ampelinus]|uniref:Hemolysin type calcium-binding protein n=1 Tax=Xylophilus ampelinus TaxID=54067 RepID=A0A318SNX3_9BURK|nr:hypothetical protein [Xylophilus ampelinus]MCS4509801.1 hypothetical protein [Xylophilus ampelinus]PYE78670.1 hypothetical protein DFQ15_10528 [Xylophilus ampelinus]